MATASSSLTDHLRCAICTELYTKPVSLSCQHTFCEDCIQQLLKAGFEHCPECNNFIKNRNFEINRILQNLVQQLILEEVKQEDANAHRCPEHHEELTLFCVTDKKLICLVCRDGREHARHSFRPVTEEEMEVKRVLSPAMDLLRTDINKVVKFKKRQRREIAATRGITVQWKNQISTQFEELRQELALREAEEWRRVDERSGLEGMEKNLAVMEEVLAHARARMVTLQSGFNISDPRDFLVWWLVRGSAEVRGKLSSPSGSFPRLCLQQNRLAIQPPSSLLLHVNWRRMERSVAWNVGSAQLPWVTPLFGNMFDRIWTHLWGWTFGRFTKGNPPD